MCFLIFAVLVVHRTKYEAIVWSARAYPRFKKWGTKHGEREERGADWGVGGVSPSPPGEGSGGGYAPPQKISELKMASFGAF